MFLQKQVTPPSSFPLLLLLLLTPSSSSLARPPPPPPPQDERYLLKFHTGAGASIQAGGREEAKKIHSPVIKFTTMLVRPVATNKRAFYLMNTTQVPTCPPANLPTRSPDHRLLTWPPGQLAT